MSLKTTPKATVAQTILAAHADAVEKALSSVSKAESKGLNGHVREHFRGATFQPVAAPAPTTEQNSDQELSGDLLVHIARAAVAAGDKSQRLEEDEAGARKEHGQLGVTYTQSASESAREQYTDLRRALSSLEASSAVGAALQLTEALSLVDLAANGDGEITSRDKDAIDRLISSALRYIERSNNLRLAEIGFQRLRNPHLDPWEPAGERIARVKKSA